MCTKRSLKLLQNLTEITKLSKNLEDYGWARLHHPLIQNECLDKDLAEAKLCCGAGSKVYADDKIIRKIKNCFKTAFQKQNIT